MATKDITTITGYSSLTAGSHTLGVKATDSTGTKTDSTMETLSFTKLAAPTNDSISGDNYSFEEVANVDSYDIYAGDTLLGSVDTARVDITGGYNFSSGELDNAYEKVWVLGLFTKRAGQDVEHVYGWHKVQPNNNTDVFENVSLIYIDTVSNYGMTGEATGHIVKADGTTVVNSQNWVSVPSNFKGLCYLKGDSKFYGTF